MEMLAVNKNKQVIHFFSLEEYMFISVFYSDNFYSDNS